MLFMACSPATGTSKNFFKNLAISILDILPSLLTSNSEKNRLKTKFDIIGIP